VLMLMSRRVGVWVDRMHPRSITLVGFGSAAASMFWLSQVLTPDAAVWQLVLPMAVLGVSNACMWSPLAVTATRNLPMRSAGAGAGVYNTTRQVGAVLGSAAIAARMESRLAANGLTQSSFSYQPGAMPAEMQEQFAHAMGQSMLLPTIAFICGVGLVMFFDRPSHAQKETAVPGPS
jgi:MFS family permease